MLVKVHIFSILLALAIKCYQCEPDGAQLVNALQKANQERETGGLSFCAKPNETLDCSKDPNIGQIADSCYTASILVDNSMYGMVSYYIHGCGLLSGCSLLKNLTCSNMETIVQNFPGSSSTQCDVTCCEEDLCNYRPDTYKSVSAQKSSNAVIFSIFLYFYLALASLF